MGTKSAEELMKDTPQASSPRSPKGSSQRSQSFQAGSLGDMVSKNKEAQKSQIEQMQLQAARAQNQNKAIVAGVHFQVEQIQSDLAEIIDEYYNGLPANWTEINHKQLLPESAQYLANIESHELKLELQNGAFVTLAERIMNSMRFGFAPTPMPALIGLENTPLLGPSH